MKNLSRFFVLGALAAGMASCSNDLTPDQPGGEQQTVTEGGYLAFNIQLPTEAGTRAGNDVFDDGKANEYAYKNAAILLFTGTGDNDATFQYAYDIKNLEGINGESQITTTYKKAIEVKSMSMNEGDHILGLVMLNYSDVFKISVAGESTTFKIGETSLTPGTTSFTDIKAITASVTAASDKNPFIIYNGETPEAFFMTNTVLCDAPGGMSDPSSGNLTILADLGNKLYATEKEAEDKAKGTVFVERALAKVTVAENEMTVSFKIKESASTSAATAPSATIEGFKLGNVEYSSYTVRNMASDCLNYNSSLITPAFTNQKYRFVGWVPMGYSDLQPNVNFYRTYWAQTPSYDKGRSFNGTYTSYSNTGNEHPLYCFENTFTVDNQDYDNTTRAVLKVKFNGGSDFYIINENEELYYTKENAQSQVAAYVANYPALQNEITTALENAAKDKGETINKQEIKYTDYFQITYATQEVGEGENKQTEDKLEADGQWKVANITPKGEITLTTFESETDAVNAVNAEVKVVKYEGGYAYYPIVIKHFGDELTPWEHESDTENAYQSTSASYGNDPTASQNYLGRFGLVRNNWYDIQVSKIMKLGSAVDPTTGEINNKPDDNNDVPKYIAFKINMLKWAKRTHDYILK